MVKSESASKRNRSLSKSGKRILKKKVAIFVTACLVFLGTLANVNIGPAQAAVGTNVVISEIYGGGGNNGASYKNDYIELYNPTNSSVSLAGWSIQYASATGSFNSITNLSGSIGARQYYLVKQASGGGGTAELPTPNATGTINLSAASGKVALAKVTTAVSGSTDNNVVDFVGYGSANNSETSPAGTLSTTTSAERKDNNGGTVQGQGNGWDTNNNANDLVITSNLAPQNSSSPAEPSSLSGGIDNDHIGLGNPSGATAVSTNSNNYLMVKPQFTLSYNNSRRGPNWVSWHLDSTDIGSASRQDNFRADTTLPSGWYQVTGSEFSGSGFDRGHMTPSGDRTSSVDNNSATFLMTNMLPQAPNNNQIVWETLESYSRKLVAAGYELYIISGGHGTGGTGANGYKTTVGNGVVVPETIWKVIVVLPNGNNDVSRVSTSTRVIAVMVPNNQTSSNQSWGNYRVSVDSIESLTGYNFLTTVSTSIQNTIEAKVDSGATN